MPLNTGKLPPKVLARSLRHIGARDGRVVLGPKLGEDAAVVRLGGQLIVLKTDPVTYASDLIGWYAVHVNANDVATRGATPAWFQAVILLPEGCDEALPERISKQISDACCEIGVAVTGGHTEVTPGISNPIVIGDMHGVLGKRKPVLTSGARVGDAIVLTKAAGIEGTATIARARRQELERALGKRLVSRASKYLFEPGLSIIPEANAALAHRVRAMHDPTEGGVLMGAYELAQASRRAIRLIADDVPVLPETRMICDHFEIDPLGLLGSGALLATFRPSDADEYVDALADIGVDARVVGEVLSGKGRSTVVRDGAIRRLSSCERDELLRIS